VQNFGDAGVYREWEIFERPTYELAAKLLVEPNRRLYICTVFWLAE